MSTRLALASVALLAASAAVRRRGSLSSVRGDAFWKWFGSSVVRTPDGEPLVVYHATAAEPFEVFRTSGFQAHFGTFKAASDRMSYLDNFDKTIGRKRKEFRILPIYLNIENPLDLPDLASVYKNEDGEFEVYDKDSWKEDNSFPTLQWESDSDLAEYLWRNRIIDSDEFWDAQYDVDLLMDILKRKGYDGIRYKNGVEDPGSISWIPFSSNQIKSATNNSGNFDPLDPRMSFNIR